MQTQCYAKKIVTSFSCVWNPEILTCLFIPRFDIFDSAAAALTKYVLQNTFEVKKRDNYCWVSFRNQQKPKITFTFLISLNIPNIEYFVRFNSHTKVHATTFWSFNLLNWLSYLNIFCLFKFRTRVHAATFSRTRHSPTSHSGRHQPLPWTRPPFEEDKHYKLIW